MNFEASISTTPGCLEAILWEFGDGKTSEEFEVAHLFETPGVFEVTLTATGPGGSTSDNLTITVFEDGDDDSDDDGSDDDNGDDDDDDSNCCGC